MIITIKYENKIVYSEMIKQYVYYYLNAACDWFDEKSGAKPKSIC